MKKPDFCARCGVFHVEPCPRMLSRRRFLFLGAAAGITLAVAPAVELFAPEQVPPFQQFDAILKQVYEPFIAEYINRPPVYVMSLAQKQLYENLLGSDRRYVAYQGGRGTGRLALTDQAS